MYSHDSFFCNIATLVLYFLVTIKGKVNCLLNNLFSKNREGITQKKKKNVKYFQIFNDKLTRKQKLINFNYSTNNDNNKYKKNYFELWP